MPRGKRTRASRGTPAWMTTYADMVTLLLCFFVLLYSFSNLDVQKFRAIMSAFQGSLGVLTGGKTISTHPALGSPLIELHQTLSLTQAEIEQMQRLYERLLAMIASGELPGSVELHIEGRGLVIRFADRLFFDLGKAVLRPDARSVLRRVSSVLKDLPNHIRVEGHTDNLPIRNARFPSNWELSTARATNVVRYLIEEMGFSPKKLSAAGYGEYRPVADNDTEEGRARNRRVDIVILRLGLSAAEPGTAGGPEQETEAGGGTEAGSGSDVREAGKSGQ